MKIYWKDGFYMEGVNTIPSGAVEITPEQHRDLLNQQASGKVLITFPDGKPFATEREFTLEQLAQGVRAQRDAKISQTDYLAMPDYPLTSAQKSQLKAYRQALRDITKQDRFPWDGQAIPWPELPTFMQPVEVVPEPPVGEVTPDPVEPPAEEGTPDTETVDGDA